jgi:Ca2+-binding EF-hand superfamily protein
MRRICLTKTYNLDDHSEDITMHKPQVIKIGLVITATSLSTVALAKDGQSRFPISIADAAARVSANFAKADIDNDGLLSKDEFAQLRPEQSRRKARSARKKRQEHPDRGGPKHSQTWENKTQEMRAKLAQAYPERAAQQAQIRAATALRMFELLDADDNGLVDAEEFVKADKRELGRQARQQAAFAHLDANDDGVLTPTEVPNPAVRLRRLDTDGDGEVSKREMRKGGRAQFKAASS